MGLSDMHGHMHECLCGGIIGALAIDSLTPGALLFPSATQYKGLLSKYFVCSCALEALVYRQEGVWLVACGLLPAQHHLLQYW